VIADDSRRERDPDQPVAIPINGQHISPYAAVGTERNECLHIRLFSGTPTAVTLRVLRERRANHDGTATVRSDDPLPR